MTRSLHAIHDTTVTARLLAPTPLRYRSGADVATGRPPHVRAASALRAFAGGFWIAQDDAHFLAIVGADGAVDALPLPPGADGRRVFSERDGNKRHKMDLEAAALLPDGRLCFFGSGSKAARRRVVVVGADRSVRVHDAGALYDALEAARAFSGAELNLEGAVVVAGALRLFNRGNGDAGAAHPPTDASVELDAEAFGAWLDGRGPLPALGAIVRYELGTIAGVRLGFTDAAALPDGRVAFLAAAEASPDAYRDGAVHGCRLGIIDGERVRTFDVVTEDGGLCRLKLEGLELREVRGGVMRFVVVADVDDPDAAALWAEVEVGVERGGGWGAAAPSPW